jgi:competence ComEA-like helix-hairpin-helix protein
MSRRLVPVILMIAGIFALACSKAEHAGSATVPPTLPHAVNINNAPLEELQKIPHIGESLARKIIEHRETNGPFRRAEHLMLIQGVSDKRFRKIRPLVRVE